MLTMSIPHIKDVLIHGAHRNNKPVMIWGPPGGGKSDAVHQFTDAIGGHLVDLRLSSYESVDLHGLPDLEGDLTYWKPPSTLPFELHGQPAPGFPTDKPIVLFFDEVTSSSPGVYAVLYQLTLDRCVNEHKLMDNVIIVLAGNREGDRGVVNRMPTPLANRLIHVEAGVDHEAWTYDYAIPNELSPIGIAFVQWKPSALMTFDPAKSDKVFSTPRSFSDMLQLYADDEIPELTKQALVHGTVGDGVATEFLAFAKNWENMIPLDQVRDDPAGCPVPGEDELSVRFSMAVAISGDMTSQNAEGYHTYLKRLGDEMVTVAWSMAIRREQKVEEKTGSLPENSVETSDAYMQFAKEYRSIWKN